MNDKTKGWPALFGLCCGLLALAFVARATALALPASKSVNIPSPWFWTAWLPEVPWSTGLVAMIAFPIISGLAYLGAVHALSRCPEDKSLSLLTAGVCGMTALCTLQASLFSSDLVLYQMLGLVQNQFAANPYLVGLSPLDQEMLLKFFPDGLELANTVVYGPALLFLYSTLSFLVAGNASALLLVLKLLSAVCFLASVRFVWRMSRDLCPERAVMITALMGLNPLLLTQLVSEAHNEVVLACVLTGSAWLELKGKSQFASLGFVLATYMKITLGLCLPFYLVYLWRKKDKRSIGLVFGWSALLGGFFVSLYGLDGVEGMLANLKAHEKFLTNAFLASAPYILKLVLPKTWFGALINVYPVLVNSGRLLILWPLYRLWKAEPRDFQVLFLQISHAFLLIYLFGILFLWPHYFTIPLVLGIMAANRVMPKACIYLSIMLPYVNLTHLYDLSYGNRAYVVFPLYLPAIYLLVRELASSHLGEAKAP